MMKYLTDDYDGHYFSFSKRIHERAFLDFHKKLVIGSVPAFR